MKTAVFAFALVAALAGLADGRRATMLEAPSGSLPGLSLTSAGAGVSQDVAMVTDRQPQL
ncbi:hypothetical protein [Pontivivens ytuae]|uniref:Uncharacterized protein n=1 Tax=Pontivivens ytuae TaxID=2789856 RepID=A0A7S9LU85_9RHOB|nr:hypothetical protein [Pontivivens ytuae]QPH55411.1 hypothetical protein I0K15_06665 [Pontivivens ytuae]